MLIPPIVPLPVVCQPCPVCWLTNALCLKGFVLPVACTVRPPGGDVAFCGDAFLAKGFVPVGVVCSGCCCCCGANGDGWKEGAEKGDEPIGGGDCCWKPVVCFAKGLVEERLSELAPVGLLRSFGSAAPVADGSMDCRKGLVDVCCCCKGSAIVGSGIGCCEKSGTPFCGIGARLFCGLNGCGV